MIYLFGGTIGLFDYPLMVDICLSIFGGVCIALNLYMLFNILRFVVARRGIERQGEPDLILLSKYATPV